MLGFSFLRRLPQSVGLALALVAVQPWAVAAPHEPGARFNGPKASLQAQAVRQVAQDRVRITLAHEVSGKNQADVARELGKAVQQALSAAKGSKAVSARSGSYGVWPMNDEQGRISNWRGRAEIILESDNFAAASDLAGQLGDTMAVAQVGFYLSPEARAACEAELLDDASRAFRERASALAKSFGFSDYSIRELSLNDTGARYDAAPRTMAMAADKSVAVPLEPGKEQVSVSISGSIFLRSAKE